MSEHSLLCELHNIREDIKSRYNYTDKELDIFLFGYEEAFKDVQNSLYSKDKLLKEVLNELNEFKTLLSDYDIGKSVSDLSELLSNYKRIIYTLTEGFFSGITYEPDVIINKVEDVYRNYFECVPEQKQQEDKITQCEYWKKGHWYIKDMDTCMGTREQDPCDCGGDRRKCNYY